MKYSIVLVLFTTLLSCNYTNQKKLVVYPEYCHGCILRNFLQIKKEKKQDEFITYIDTTDEFLNSFMNRNGYRVHHIKNDSIKFIFGDYSNILYIDNKGLKIELKTNETLGKEIEY